MFDVYCLCSSTPLLAAIREDDSPDLSEVKRILQEHLKVSFPDLRKLKHVCLLKPVCAERF